MGKKVKEKKRKGKKEKAPAYFLTPTGSQVTNYNVYYLNIKEKIIYFLLAFVTGAAVGYLFYGGIGKDEWGNPTTLTNILNCIVCIVTGFIAAAIFLPARAKSITAKRKRELAIQFRDMLEALTTSINAGRNVIDAFTVLYDDLKIQYEEDANILHEVEVILSYNINGFDIEDALEDFGKRSGVADIMNFAAVFKVAYPKGANMKDVLNSTTEVLCSKIEIKEEIETMVTANKSEQNMMVFMPVILIGLIKMMGDEFAENFTTLPGIIATTIGVALFIAAYYTGKKILDIKL